MPKSIRFEIDVTYFKFLITVEYTSISEWKFVGTACLCKGMEYPLPMELFEEFCELSTIDVAGLAQKAVTNDIIRFRTIRPTYDQVMGIDNYDKTEL